MWPQFAGKFIEFFFIFAYLLPNSIKVLRLENIVSITMPIEISEFSVKEFIKDRDLFRNLELEYIKGKLSSRSFVGKEQREATAIVLENTEDVYIFDKLLSNTNDQRKIIKFIFEKIKYTCRRNIL